MGGIPSFPLPGGFIGQSLRWELTQQWSKGSEEFTPHGSFPTADAGWNLCGAAHFLHYCFCSHQDDEDPVPTAKVCSLCLYSVSYAQIYAWINNLALQAQEKSLLYFNLQRLLNPDPAGNQWESTIRAFQIRARVHFPCFYSELLKLINNIPIKMLIQENEKKYSLRIPPSLLRGQALPAARPAG